MKLGVSAFGWSSTFDESHFHLLPEVRAHGLEAFEVPLFDPAAVPAAAVRRALEGNDLAATVCCILPAGINPVSPDAATRRRSQEHLRQCVETAAELGARLLGGPMYAPIGYLPGRRRSDDEWSWAVEAFQQLGETLDRYDMTLALEPVNFGETFFLTTAADTREFCKAIANPRIGVLVDTFHANIEEKDIVASCVALGPLLRHVHASENDRGIPGTGHLDFPGLIRALSDTEYEGYLIIEGLGRLAPGTNSPIFQWRRPSETGDQIAFEGARYLRGLLRDSGSATR
jgi:D-psicose/D-tagatose/L-ribulose 3-epimerase